jgi:hypothetical protein
MRFASGDRLGPFEIGEIRDAPGDGPSSPRLIRTVHYRSTSAIVKMTIFRHRGLLNTRVMNDTGTASGPYRPFPRPREARSTAPLAQLDELPVPVDADR